MIQATIFLGLLLASPSVADTSDGKEYLAELRGAIRSSNDCLLNEVNSRLDDNVLEIADPARSQIRMAAANACYESNDHLAHLANDFRDGSKSLKNVNEEMLVQSLGIANAMISVRLKANADKARK